MQPILLRPNENGHFHLKRRPGKKLKQSNQLAGFYSERLVLKGGDHRVEVFLHFQGKALDKIRHHECWRVTRMREFAADRFYVRQHYRCIPVTGQPACEADSLALRHDGQVVFTKSSGRREATGAPMVGRRVLSRTGSI